MGKTKKSGEQESASQTDIDFGEQSLESALERLEEIVNNMDSDEIELDESIELFQEGMQLTRYCREKISEAEQKVSQLVEDAEGELSLEEFENE